MLAEVCLNEARRHARDLAPSVSQLLTQQDWRPRDISAVLVSRGPGSYTGLRVGIMSAKTFAFATGCVLLGIDTFAAIAQQSPSAALCLDVLADAQQEKVYVQRFERGEIGGHPAAIASLTIRPFADWAAGCDGSVFVTGPGATVFESRLPKTARVVATDIRDPHPASLLRIGLRRFQAGEHDDVWSLEPLYLRPSAAEEQASRAP